MLSYERTGSGPPLLLLHGIGMRRQWWRPCLPALSARHDVVAVDFPGFGASAALAAGDEPTVGRLADAIEELAGELALGHPHVAGLSMGGLVGLELARRGSVASACAISPAGFATGWERSFLAGSLRATMGVVRAVAPHAGRFTARAPLRTVVFGQVTARPWRIPGPEAAGHLRAVATSDLSRTLPHVAAADFFAPDGLRAPVTIAWGTRDHLLLPRQADRALARLPGARLVRLAGCGHVPTYDDTEQTVRVVLESAAA